MCEVQSLLHSPVPQQTAREVTLTFPFLRRKALHAEGHAETTFDLLCQCRSDIFCSRFTDLHGFPCTPSSHSPGSKKRGHRNLSHLRQNHDAANIQPPMPPRQGLLLVQPEPCSVCTDGQWFSATKQSVYARSDERPFGLLELLASRVTGFTYNASDLSELL
jgi:hypothetical protein